MNSTLSVAAVSGGPYAPSRSLVLVNALVEALASRLSVTSETIELSDIARGLGSALSRKELPSEIENKIQAIEQSDLLIVVSPVYRGSYPGLLKHLFDLVGQDALIGKPVLLGATGGSPLHGLMIDHQLRPLMSFFHALALPTGIYATESDFLDYQVHSDTLRARIQLATERTASLVRQRQPRLQALA